MKDRFGKVRDVRVEDPSTWLSEIYLTLDIDWACDEIILDSIRLIEKAGVAATWFVTHETPVLERLRENPRFELGIHPNFNFLLDGDPRNGANAEEVIDRLLAIVPDAKSVRSHSMMQSTNILQIFVERGLTHDSNHFIPEQSALSLEPWVLWNGLVKVPYFWEDDAVCLFPQNTPVLELVRRAGLKVFDFHPIHVFLNTEHMGRYERTRPLHRNPLELSEHRCEGVGTRTRLETLLGLVR